MVPRNLREGSHLKKESHGLVVTVNIRPYTCMSTIHSLFNCKRLQVVTFHVPSNSCTLFALYNWGEPERAPRGHDVYCTCVRACVRACICACVRRTYVRVGEACLGVSEVSVAGNECSLGSDGWLRMSTEGQERLAWHSAAEQRSSRRSVSSLRSFYHCTLAMNVKFALEQPSGTGVGHELA